MKDEINRCFKCNDIDSFKNQEDIEDISSTETSIMCSNDLLEFNSSENERGNLI